MKTDPPLTGRNDSDLQAESAFMDWVHQLVSGASALQALQAGEVDAVMDPATCSAVLLPVARAAARVRIARQNTRSARAARNARASRTAAVARTGAANHLLAALPARDYARLLPGLEPARLSCGDVLHESGQSLQYIYFPTECLVSLLMVVDGHKSLEVGLVGREGVIGARAALGIAISPVRALVQESGMALRIRATRFMREFHCSPHLQQALFRSTDALLMQVSQTAACNHFHVVQARLARWLLMTHERLSSGVFHLTQEFLAEMLGVRRVSVTTAASALQRQNLIRYRRGNITILDQQGLEAACCSCYQRLQRIGPAVAN
jgi:CRP-like cAMP-binding protein